jgi:spore coat-associated protein N
MKTTKILLPLATLVAAGAIAVGSGATFTSTSANTISSVTSGTLTQSNTKADEAVFDLTNIKPGDVVNGTLTIKNTGSLDADFSLTEVTSANAFAKDNLTLTITNTATPTVPVWSGNFGDLVDGAKNTLGEVAAGASNTYVFSAKLATTADNTQQGKTASASFAWDSVQENGQTTEQ